jgi:hypothetical protein
MTTKKLTVKIANKAKLKIQYCSGHVLSVKNNMHANASESDIAKKKN